jgi:hypothetical protein
MTDLPHVYGGDRNQVQRVIDESWERAGRHYNADLNHEDGDHRGLERG